MVKGDVDMKKKFAVISISLPIELIRTIKENAKREERSISNYVCVLLKKALSED